MRSLAVLLLTSACSPIPTGHAAPSTAPVAISDAVSLPDIAESAVKGVVSVTTRRGSSDWVNALGGEMGAPDFGISGLGSGVVINGDGLVVTNHHVVEGASAVRVTLHDGTQLEADVVGSDPRSDVAVLQMRNPPGDLHPLEWGDSAGLRLGETVLAIGNPFGVGHTLTRGIVSAKGRARVGIVEYEDFIQTDAAINPGNSGGALVDLRGHVVGIPTAIFSRSGGSQGMGFAIPAVMAKTIAADIAEDGKVDRGWLGVGIAPDPNGIRIGGISAGGAGEKAGLKDQDVVTSFNGKPMDSLEAFRSFVALTGAGEDFEAEVLRDGKKKTVRGTLGRRPDDPTN